MQSRVLLSNLETGFKQQQTLTFLRHFFSYSEKNRMEFEERKYNKIEKEQEL